jgi:UDP-N-acetylmuramate--alanine ligase
MQLFDPQDPRPVHFMGIAGAGMSALALVARRRGIEVSGCDIDPRAAGDVVSAGARVYTGHSAEHAAGSRAVVYTSAVSLEHDELQEAARLGIPVVRRAEALAEIVRGATVIGVAGTHGKTTTTAMLTEALVAAGNQPTGIVGGRVAAWEGNARLGSDTLFVLEADEYDKSFLTLHPTIAIVNNVEADHLECYGDFASLEGAFVEFAGRARRVLVGGDDPGAIRVGGRVGVPVWTVGLSDDADVRIRDIVRHATETEALIDLPDASHVRLRLRVPGLHNLRNAGMALGAVYALGADVEKAARALAEFSGVGRRFEVVADIDGVTVVDDYAHHAAEISATIEAARQRFPERQIIAVFQPHLYSRTQQQYEVLGGALQAADRVVVTDIYPAREKPIEGVTGKLVAGAAGGSGVPVDWVPDVTKLPGYLSSLIRAGDVVLMLGAGDITHSTSQLARRLTEEAA